MERVPSDDPPASECRYTMFGDQLYVTVVTEAQLQQAARPDSVGALFDRFADEAAEAPADGESADDVAAQETCDAKPPAPGPDKPTSSAGSADLE